MLIRKKIFNNYINSIKKILLSLNRSVDKLTYNTNSNKYNIHILNESSKKIIKTIMLQDKKIINLVEIIRLLTKDNDRKKIIAVTSDGTKLSIGDFLDAEDLYPIVKEEFNIASF